MCIDCQMGVIPHKRFKIVEVSDSESDEHEAVEVAEVSDSEWDCQSF